MKLRGDRDERANPDTALERLLEALLEPQGRRLVGGLEAVRCRT
jgi:hypothetical protein